MKLLRVAGGLCLATLLPCGAEAGGVAISGRMSTLGFGLELTAGLTERLNVRLGGNFFNYQRTFTPDEDELDFDLELRTASALLDFHPFAGGFRLSGGVVGNRNEVRLVGRSTTDYEIGDGTYRASDVGALTGSVDFKEAGAYAGIGWTNAVREGKRVGFVFDLGVAFQGAPRVHLSANGPIAGDPGFQSDLRQEERNIDEDARAFRYYPVVSLGISVKVF